MMDLHKFHVLVKVIVCQLSLTKPLKDEHPSLDFWDVDEVKGQQYNYPFRTIQMEYLEHDGKAVSFIFLRKFFPMKKECVKFQYS